MMINIGAPIPPDQVQTVTDYLTKNFPEKPAPAPVLIAGDTKVTIKEWTVPTPGSRPHDPLAGPDGTCGIQANSPTSSVISIPRPAKSKNTRCRRIPAHTASIFGQDGKIWYTANFGGYIGKLDPKTGAVVKYTLPDPKAKDPHTPHFDQNGILWFTVQGANMLGGSIRKPARSSW